MPDTPNQQQIAQPDTQKVNPKQHTRVIVFILIGLLCLTPLVGPPLALLLGIILAQTLGHPFIQYNGKATNWLLKSSVVGLGFGMNVQSALQAGEQGIVFSVVSIVGTLILGGLLGVWLRIDKHTTYLISSGTAICGGSAIAAVAPLIKAEEKHISVALGVVFILNAIALFIFPPIGHLLELSQQQFGIWSAIAIHDTSSVVGAASKYGAHALQVATTVKLARALWIIPLAIGTALWLGKSSGNIKIPYFIGFFILAMVANTYVPSLQAVSPFIVQLAKAGLTLTLFLIGAGLSRQAIRAVGIKPLLLGMLLWVSISGVALWAVCRFIS